jgi:hypothetical protein
LGEGIRSQRGRKLQIGLSRSLFLAINAKGGENIKQKQKDRTTTTLKNFKNEVLISKFQLVYFSISI